MIDRSIHFLDISRCLFSFSIESCLGGNCSSTEQCKGDHVVCDPTRDICVCEEGYFVDQDGNCVRRMCSLLKALSIGV